MNILKKLQTLLVATAFVGGLSFFTFAIVTPDTAYAADPKQAACDGLALTGGACDDPNDPTNPNSSNNRLSQIISTVINIFSMVVGVVAVIMIIIGGFKYITSMGDSSSTASAKNTILYAIIGLVIVAFSQVIVRFVLGRI